MFYMLSTLSTLLFTNMTQNSTEKEAVGESRTINVVLPPEITARFNNYLNSFEVTPVMNRAMVKFVDEGLATRGF